MYTPSPTEAAPGDGLPVLVYFHGGGYFAGSPASPWYDGRTFNRDGVVTVTLSYRLGFDGFGWMESAPANRGVRDWLLGLEWVQHHIAAFGGDPRRVTIVGQSAGGGAVLTLQWQNYVEIWQRSGMLTWLKNTAILSVTITALQVLTGSFAAYGFSKAKFAGRHVLFLVDIGTIAVPWQSFMIPQFVLVSEFKLSNTLWSLIILQAFGAFGVFLMKQFYDTIPEELSEAARLDGLSGVRHLVAHHDAPVGAGHRQPRAAAELAVILAARHQGQGHARMSILDSFRLDGQVALVTGASRGLGRAMAVALAQAGADVAVASDTTSPETVAEIEALGRRVLDLPCDLCAASVAELGTLVDRVVAEFGRLDILVNTSPGAATRARPDASAANSDTTASTISAVRPFTATRAPASARVDAMARPMPWVEPVTRAVLPVRSIRMRAPLSRRVGAPSSVVHRQRPVGAVQHRHRRLEHPRQDVAAHDLLRRPELDHPAVLHRAQVIGVVPGEVDVVQHDDDRASEFVGRPAQLTHHLHRMQHVEVVQRFVEQHDVGVLRQHHCHVGALPLPS